jgi:hypothetical protein
MLWEAAGTVVTEGLDSSEDDGKLAVAKKLAVMIALPLEV